jgi:hypothetical protein
MYRLRSTRQLSSPTPPRQISHPNIRPASPGAGRLLIPFGSFAPLLLNIAPRQLSPPTPPRQIPHPQLRPPRQPCALTGHTPPCNGAAECNTAATTTTIMATAAVAEVSATVDNGCRTAGCNGCDDDDDDDTPVCISPTPIRPAVKSPTFTHLAGIQS